MRCWHVVVLGLTLVAVTPPQPAVPSLPTGYAGAEVCMACHEDISNAFPKSPHHRLSIDAKRGWEGRACEACHGPGQKHAESGDPTLIRNPANLAAADVDKICLTCHLNQPTQIGRLESSHAHNQVSCTTCHKVHGTEPLVVRKAVAVNTLCASCH